MTIGIQHDDFCESDIGSTADLAGRVFVCIRVTEEISVKKTCLLDNLGCQAIGPVHVPGCYGTGTTPGPTRSADSIT